MVRKSVRVGDESATSTELADRSARKYPCFRGEKVASQDEAHAFADRPSTETARAFHIQGLLEKYYQIAALSVLGPYFDKRLFLC